MSLSTQITCTQCIVIFFTVLIVTFTVFAIEIATGLCDMALTPSTNTISFAFAFGSVVFPALCFQ